MSNMVTIAIPIYKEIPNPSEIASYNQCLRILGNYPIVLFVPKGLSMANYDTSNKNVSVMEVPKEYLSTRERYSAFMLTQKFYEQFTDSEYILIYQLDAWIFRDELLYWCKQGYHYIGAPWAHRDKNGNLAVGGVGNGGFSLRHVKKSIEVLDAAKLYRDNPDLKEKEFDPRPHSHNKILANSLILNDPTKDSSIGSFYQATETRYLHAEDGYWAGASRVLVSDFKIPVNSIAYKFSMEGEAAALYRLNNNTLPFGCHAWQARDKKFWSEHIKYDNEPIIRTSQIKDTNVTSIFYKSGKDSLKGKIAAIISIYPKIRVREIDMGDDYQIVTTDNNVVQGQDAHAIVNTLVTPITARAITRCHMKIFDPTPQSQDNMINILMRTSNRPNGFKRMIDSIRSQTYKNYRIIVSVDNDETESYVKKYDDVEYIRVNRINRRDSSHFPYNLYFNQLINEVKTGWVFFVDDDDTLYDTESLHTIANVIRNPDLLYVFKLQYIGRVIPNRSFGKGITSCDISTQNIVVHSSHASDSQWPDKRMGDYHYISKLADAMGNKIEWVDKLIYRITNAGVGQQKDI